MFWAAGNDLNDVERWIVLGHANRRSRSTCRSHGSSWFQLAKMRLTRISSTL